MKAEEYLIRHSHTTNVTYTDGSIKQEEDISFDDAKYAVRKARSEERSKALSYLEEVMRDNDDVHADFDVLKDKFKDLINK